MNIQDITCVILSGGRATRMKGLDKGLQPFMGLPLVEHVYTRIKMQVGTVIINANRNLDQYREICTTVCTDESEDYAGPLAGFMAGLKLALTPYLLTVPCDAPYVAHDLVQVFVDFDTPGDDPLAFCNINSTEELERLGKWGAKSPEFAS